MQKGPRRLLFYDLFGHLTMGAGLGVLLALLLLICDTRNVFGSIVNSESPRLALAIFVGTLTSLIATGATISGWIFNMMEDE
jgi:hypothetical protein